MSWHHITNKAKLFSKFKSFKPGMHNSDLMAGQKNVADTFAGQIGKFFPFLYSIYIKNPAKSLKIGALRASLNALVGHILHAGRMLCMPALN